MLSYNLNLHFNETVVVVQVSGKSTVKDIREAFASKAGISKAKAKKMAFYQGDDCLNDHPRRQVAGELKLRDGDTLVVRPTLSGGGVRQRINEKSDECKTYALDIAKDVQNKVKSSGINIYAVDCFKKVEETLNTFTSEADRRGFQQPHQALVGRYAQVSP